MNSDPEIKQRLEPDQAKPPKKSLWKKIKEFIIRGLEKGASGEGRDWGDW